MKSSYDMPNSSKKSAAIYLYLSSSNVYGLVNNSIILASLIVFFKTKSNNVFDKNY